MVHSGILGSSAQRRAGALVIAGARQHPVEQCTHHRAARHGLGTVHRHGKSVGADAAAHLHMVYHIGHHGKEQTAGRRRAEALERNTDGNRDQSALPQPREDAARSAQQQKPAAHLALAEPVGQRHQQHRGQRHGQRPHHGQQRLRCAPCTGAAQKGVVYHPLAIVGHGAVF